MDAKLPLIFRIYIRIINNPSLWGILFVVYLGALINYASVISNASDCKGTRVYENCILWMLICHIVLTSISITRWFTTFKDNYRGKEVTLAIQLFVTYLITYTGMATNLNAYLYTDKCDDKIMIDVRNNIIFFMSIHVLPSSLEIVILIIWLMYKLCKRYFKKEQLYSQHLLEQFDDNDICSICMEQYIFLDVIKPLLQCQHTFHKKCINEWLKRKSNCPICRSDVLIDEII
jgi:hypothetical protein